MRGWRAILALALGAAVNSAAPSQRRLGDDDDDAVGEFDDDDDSSPPQKEEPTLSRTRAITGVGENKNCFI